MGGAELGAGQLELDGVFAVAAGDLHAAGAEGDGRVEGPGGALEAAQELGEAGEQEALVETAGELGEGVGAGGGVALGGGGGEAGEFGQQRRWFAGEAERADGLVAGAGDLAVQGGRGVAVPAGVCGGGREREQDLRRAAAGEQALVVVLAEVPDLDAGRGLGLGDGDDDAGVAMQTVGQLEHGFGVAVGGDRGGEGRGVVPGRCDGDGDFGCGDGARGWALGWALGRGGTAAGEREGGPREQRWGPREGSDAGAPRRISSATHGT